MSNLDRPDASGPDGASSGDDEVDSLLSLAFTGQTVTALRHLLAAQVAAAGLHGEAAEDLVLAVHELVTNAVLHGGGRGRLELLRYADRLVCAVVDHGPGGADLTVHRPATDTPGGRGLWLAHQLTGALTLTHRSDGLTATVTAPLKMASPPAGRTGPAAADGETAAPGEGGLPHR
ncbi:ATP-binding protein [Micromonospora sp. NBC_01739]|uniref:ATP-binding protein n=1 Tax=Micromonospora sp. NBC_01739 TaxID=2975985 RepID=UPI002E163E84|nr:ATP-binding protein [Micromonospora sp. NBC_01739]